MEKEKSRFEDKHRCRIIVKPESYILKNKKNTAIETDKIKENVRPHMQDNTKDHVREEGNNNHVGTNEEHLENKSLGEDVEQHIARDKLKEELQIMWHKVKLLRMSARQRL
jgi:hypothetical protein